MLSFPLEPARSARLLATLVLRRRSLAGFDEDQHPRNDKGQFALSDEDRDTLDNFGFPGTAYMVNQRLQAGDTKDAPTARVVKTLDKLMRPEPAATLHRVQDAERIDSLKVGDTYTEHGYTSTLKNPDDLSQFESGSRYAPEGATGSRHRVEVQVPEGHARLDTDRYVPGKYAMGPVQGEVVLPRGTTFRVVSKGARNVVEVVSSKYKALEGWDEDQHPRDEKGQFSGSDAYMGSLRKTGEARGSNPGGIYRDPSGQKVYVKNYKNAEQAYTEHIANQIYKAVGAKVPETAVTAKGQLVSKWMNETEGTLGQTGLTHENADKILDHFVADVFVNNWDAVGTGHDNVLIGKDKSVARVDQGGTLLYRAQGALKPTEGLSKIGEWNSLVEKNHYYNAVFKAAGVKNGDALGSRAVKQIDNLTLARPSTGWKTLVDKAAPHASESFRSRVGAMLESRHSALLEKRKELTARGLAEFNPDLHPKGEDGKFVPSAVTPEHAESMWKAYKEGVKHGPNAEKHGYTKQQVKNTIDLLIKKEKKLAAKTEEAKAKLQAAAPVVVPATEPTPSPWDKTPWTTEPVPSSVSAPVSAPSSLPSTGGKVKPLEDYVTKSTPAVAPTKTWNELQPHEKIIKAEEAGLVWKEKTSGPKAGQFAYFDKYGTQVSSPFPKGTDRQAAVDTLYQGKGISSKALDPNEHVVNLNTGAKVYAQLPETSAKALYEAQWPINNEITRAAGASYPKAVNAHYQKWINGLPPSERQAIEAYTGSAYTNINEYLRTGVKDNYYSSETKANAISKALDKAPSPPPPELVWRGLPPHVVESALKDGNTITLKGFQSTSIDPHSAWSYKGLLLEIKPTKGAYLEPVTKSSGEREFLLPHAAKYKVIGHATVRLGNTKHKVVQLEMLPHGK